MPTFCRHNRLVQNCPICAREQAIELRPVLSSSAPRASQPRTTPPRPVRSRSSSRRSAGGRPGTAVRVHRLSRDVDDGYRSQLVPGLRSSADAGRLAEELAFAAGRLRLLAEDPPGLYREVATPDGDREERTWLAFLIAFLCPLDEDDPFVAIDAARTTWRSAEQPTLAGVQTGPRTAYETSHGTRTLDAYRNWARRAGTQAAAFTGEAGWTAERRFARAFERLALPGLHRGARFDLLVTLGSLGVYELRAAALELGGENEATLAAKRALGIGDPLLLERRAADLARACEVPLEALDVGLHNWGRGERATLGLGPAAEVDPNTVTSIRAALEL